MLKGVESNPGWPALTIQLRFSTAHVIMFLPLNVVTCSLSLGQFTHFYLVHLYKVEVVVDETELGIIGHSCL